MSKGYDAKEYDRGRSGEDFWFWIEEASSLAGLNDDAKILDLGCGTGNYTLTFVEKFPDASVFGLEPDAKMVEVARGKDRDRKVNWCIGVGERMPMKADVFDCMFSSQVWHHLKDRRGTARECLRVLKMGCPNIIRTISHDQWRRKTVVQIFPEVLESEIRRYPSDDEFKAYFVEAGFRRVRLHDYSFERYTTPNEFIEVATKKLWSMFWQLTEEAISRGVAKMEDFRARNPGVQIRNDELITLVEATK